jgi:hypothetical protein
MERHRSADVLIRYTMINLWRLKRYSCEAFKLVGSNLMIRILRDVIYNSPTCLAISPFFLLFFKEIIRSVKTFYDLFKKKKGKKKHD